MAKTLTLVLMSLLSLSHLASSLTLFDAEVFLDNISTQTLTASCRSNGADIGTFVVPAVGEREFRSNILVKQRSVATCSMKLGGLSGTFDVFDYDRDKERCANRVCRWRIFEKGLFLLVNNRDYELVYNW